MSGLFPEPADDLEWMLTSGQVSGYHLAESLVRAFYGPVYRLELFLLQSPEAAEQAALDSFAAALLAPYPEPVTPPLWLLGFALETGLRRSKRTQAVPAYFSPQERDRPAWQVFDALGFDDRLGLFAHLVLGLSAAELGFLLHQSEGQATAALAGAQARLHASLEMSGLAREAQDLALDRRWPAPQPDEARLSRIAAQVDAQVNSSQARRRRSFSIKEFIWVGLAILAVLAAGSFLRESPLFSEPSPAPSPIPAYVAPTAFPRTNVVYFVEERDTLESIARRVAMPVEELEALNGITSTASLYPGQWLWISIEDAPRIVAPPTPGAGTRQPGALTMGSVSQVIENRILESASHWDTLWADIDYTPRDLVKEKGPRTVYRYQVWISQPSLSLELIGSHGSLPFERYNALNGRGYISVGNSGQVYLDPTWRPNPQTLLQNQLLAALLFPSQGDWSRPGWTFVPEGSGSIAGRPAVVVDWIDPAGKHAERLWLDARLGIILRRQMLAGTNAQQVDSEIAVQQIALDVPLPAQLFNPQVPWEGGFKQG
ncbi:MAG TPA: LysM peptidoglycan-binding domain-containing protein, partial [Anaerolineales bacterium]